MFSRDKKKTVLLAVCLFVCSAIIYMSNLRSVPAHDSTPSALIPVLLINQGDLLFDNYLPALIKAFPYFQGHFYFLTETKSGYRSVYPELPGVLLAPLYAPFVLYQRRSLQSSDEWLQFASRAEQVSAAAVAAAGVSVFFLIVLRLGARRRTALLISGANALATSAFATFGQALWQHGFAVLFMMLAVLTSLECIRRSNSWLFVLPGLFCSLAVGCRPVAVVFCVMLAIWVFVECRQGLLPMLLASAMAGVILAVYNHSVYGHVFGGYSRMIGVSGFPPEPWAVLKAFLGLLFSPGRGLFVYFPLALLGGSGLYLAVKMSLRWRSLLICLFCFVVMQVLFISLFWSGCWWGGHSYGPRLLSEIQWAVLLLIYPLLEYDKQPLKHKIFAILTAVSIFMQAVGVYCYPKGSWDSYPVNVDENPSRNWQIISNPVTRSIYAAFFQKNRT